MKKKVAFICVHNSARSQIAEELLRKYAGEKYECFSGGIEAGRINELVVDVLMEEDGIDISDKKTVSVQKLKDGHVNFDYIITVCDEGSSERCPVISKDAEKFHWSFPDPSKLEGIREEKKEKISKIKKGILEKVLKFIDEK